jgi:hypothetical protein
MGMADLATFREAEPVADNLIRALATAREGSRAYPSSVGGRRCDAIAAEIEAPNYALTAMSSDAPGRRSIEVTHKNLPALFFRAWALDLEQRLGSATDYNLLPQGEEVRKLLTTKPAAEWSSPLPATADYKTHRTFVTPPLTASGLYVIAASAKRGFDAADNRIESVSVIVSDLVLLAHPDGGSLGARVVTGDGRPVPGADVFLYAYDWSQGRRHHRVETRKADADGRTRFAFVPGRSESSYFVLARRGSDYALDPSYVSLAPESNAGETTASVVYTDRRSTVPGRRFCGRSSRTTGAPTSAASRRSRGRRSRCGCATRTTRSCRARPRRRTASAPRRASSRSRPGARSARGGSRARCPGRRASASRSTSGRPSRRSGRTRRPRCASTARRC